MKKNVILGLITATVVIMTTGCASTHTEMNVPSTQTQVNLNRDNYEMIKAGAIGTSHGFKLLGIIPLAGASEAEASADLYASVKHQLEGKPIALINKTMSKSGIYLILFSVPKVTVTGDIIQWKNDKPE